MTIRKFLCLQASVPSVDASASRPSPEEMQKMYEAFDSWRTQFASHIVDLGGKLTGSTTIVSQADDIDGISIEAREVFGGFMILAAADLEEAGMISRACPGLVGPRSQVVIREIAG
ncbi:YciI family protein [Devosia lacusdianchii]|uniref:YciI family protein n=1 Tax=Devosia lacusdianchii TaxID=2917991 RepID=UPI001F0599DD|nr:YciI family protein [Devosia sp. JXJ CY 41]